MKKLLAWFVPTGIILLLAACAPPAPCDVDAYRAASAPLAAEAGELLQARGDVSRNNADEFLAEVENLIQRAEAVPADNCLQNETHRNLIVVLQYTKNAFDHIASGEPSLAVLDFNQAEHHLNLYAGVPATATPRPAAAASGSTNRSTTSSQTTSCDVAGYRTWSDGVMQSLRRTLDPVELENAASVRAALPELEALRERAERRSVDDCLMLKHETLVFTIRHTETALEHAAAGDYIEMNQSLDRALLNQDRYNDWSVDIDR